VKQMNRRSFLKSVGCCGAAFSAGCISRGPVALRDDSGRARPSLQATEDKPNFIIIFTDDQGYQDLGCFGSPLIRTPNVDRMAREGMKFTSFYAQTVCGPSRAALMTGCYPLRVPGLPRCLST